MTYTIRAPYPKNDRNKYFEDRPGTQSTKPFFRRKLRLRQNVNDWRKFLRKITQKVLWNGPCVQINHWHLLLITEFVITWKVHQSKSFKILFFLSWSTFKYNYIFVTFRFYSIVKLSSQTNINYTVFLLKLNILKIFCWGKCRWSKSHGVNSTILRFSFMDKCHKTFLRIKLVRFTLSIRHP